MSICRDFPVDYVDDYPVVENFLDSNAFDVKLILVSGAQFVCKLLRLRPVLDLCYLRHMLHKEISFLRLTSHKNIIQLYSFSESSQYCERNNRYYQCSYYTMEYCPNGNLLDLVLKNPQGLPESNVKTLFMQLVQGVSYMHSLGYAHGDIRLENCVISIENVLKIIDFSFIKSTIEYSQDFSGSRYYMAPELLLKTPFSPPKADVFASGCVLFSLAFGCPAFDNAYREDTNYWKLCNNPESFWAGYEKKCNKTVSDKFKHLVQEMLVFDPGRRITMDDVINHKWICQ